MLVLDASFSILLFLSDPRSSKSLSLAERFREEGHTFVAPSLWTYEVTSTLQKLLHFKQISRSEVEFAVESIAIFEIELVQPDNALVRRALIWSQRLRRASAYDSFYLALAEARGCDLWTADSRLSNAAQVD